MDGTIVDRINNSPGRRLGVTKIDIGRELARLADAQDVNGLQTLFSAYSQWELRQSPGEEPQAQRMRCLDNFYVAGQIGDCIKMAGGDPLLGFRMYQENPDLTGTTVQFVSAVLQYVPPAPAPPSTPPVTPPAAPPPTSPPTA